MFFSCQALSHENCSHGDESHLNLGSGEMAIAQKAPRSTSAGKPKQQVSQALQIKSKN